MLTQLMRGDKVVSKGSLNRVRGLIYVRDAALAIVKAIETPKSRGKIINIANEKPETILSIIQNLGKLLDKDMNKVEIIEEEGTVGDNFYNYADCSMSRNILGFEPQYSFPQGAQELIELRRKQNII